uniref:Uncharacterized protein n=1 Tax=Romanomermis culicivorax TaxID=13658 RepID=A0A915IN67_ROMCU
MTMPVWKDAGTQVIYSSGVGFGTLIALSSYNKYRNNVYKDAITVCIINFITSLAAVCLVFSILGFMANATGNTMEQIVKDGMDLAFLVFPQAFSMLTTSQVWSAMFFLMIATLVLGSM